MHRCFWPLLCLVQGLCGPPSASAQQAAAPITTPQTNVAALQAEMSQAMARVRLIVNQPVTRLVRQPGMRVRVYSPGWFHEGATIPDFNTVDVRATQERIYDQAGYVTSDLNPGVVFIGSQLEFNSMTKYFYVDRTLPKRKLSEAEMLEINRLYRVIGRCEQQLAALLKPSAGRKTDGDEDSSPDSETGATVVRGRIPPSRLIYGGLGILGVLTLYGVYRKWGR